LREEDVSKPCRCACCSEPLEPAQELRFLVECDNLGDPAYLAHIRRLPSVNGRPVPVCKACQARIESSPRPVPRARPGAVRTGVLAAVGLFSVGWLLQTLLAGPRA
jgi:hypothetical protein